MAVYFVYLEERDPSKGGAKFDAPLFDQIMATTGYRCRYVRSLDELDDLRSSRWVYLDHRAEQDISEFEHPPGDVVYCTGSDGEGFSGQNMVPGLSVRIGNHERYAFPMLIAAACHRWAKTDGDSQG